MLLSFLKESMVNTLALHRPNNSGFGKPSIWYAKSPDLLHWGNHKRIVVPRDNKWESIKIGGGAPPIKTSEGWLIIYHGKGDNGMYSLFCLLLDLGDPAKVVRRASTPLLTPTEPYETEGFFPNVVFSNGIAEKDGNLYIYYGAADKSCCLAVTDISSLLNSFRGQPLRRSHDHEDHHGFPQVRWRRWWI